MSAISENARGGYRQISAAIRAGAHARLMMFDRIDAILFYIIVSNGTAFLNFLAMNRGQRTVQHIYH